MSSYCETKRCRRSESSNASPDESTSFPAGPRMRNGAFSSCPCMAAKSSLPASSADVKVRCPGSCPNTGPDIQPKESTKTADITDRINLRSGLMAIEKLCSMIFFSIFEILNKLYSPSCAINDGRPRHENRRHGNLHRRSSSVRGKKSLVHYRRDQIH